MAKKKEVSEEKKDLSIGTQLSTKFNQRERNLAIKEQMIKDGAHPKTSKAAPFITTREKNLELKAKLKNGKG